MELRIVLVDDHRLFREGMKSLLQSKGFKIVGEAGNGSEAIDRVRAHQPDVVLMDLQMPTMGGLEATRLLKSELPDLPIIILTASEDESDLFEAVKSGAQGYLLKSFDPATVVEMIQAAARGEPALTPHLAAKILSEFARQNAPSRTADATTATAPSSTTEPEVEPLTARERDVLELLVAGASNKEIAQKLIVSENTVKYHLKNILGKLHLRNRAQVVSYALRHGLARPPEAP